MRKLSEFLLASHRNASIIAFLCALLPLISLPGGFLAALLVGFVTLCRGPKSGLIVLAWVALPAISLLYLHRVGVFDVLLLRCVLVWMFAAILQKYHSWRLVLEFSVILGFVVIVSIHMIVGDMHGWWTHYFSSYLDDIGQVTSWKLSATDSQYLIKRLAPIATGVAAFIALFLTGLLTFFARWWQSALFGPGELKKEFAQIRMSRTMAIVLVVVAIGLLLKLTWVVDFFPVLLLPFTITGLSLFHFIVNIKKGLLLLLILLYVGMLLLPLFIVIILSTAGYLDTWFNFRKRMTSEELT